MFSFNNLHSVEIASYVFKGWKILCTHFLLWRPIPYTTKPCKRNNQESCAETGLSCDTSLPFGHGQSKGGTPHPPPLPSPLTCLFIFPLRKQPDVLKTTESAAHPEYLLWAHCSYCQCSGVMRKPLYSLRQKKKQKQNKKKRLPLRRWWK